MQIWSPNSPPQKLAIQSTCFETLYGGARGGGKTDAGIVWIGKPTDHPLYRGLVIRKNAEDLNDWVDRAGRMFAYYGGVVTGQPKMITFPSGALIRTGHLKDDQAYTKYQGHEYQRELIEELTQIPTEKRYLELISSCRSTVPGIDPRVFSSTNPGGVGHGWVKKRFVDVIVPNKVYTDPTTNRTRIFIPAKVDDNVDLMRSDPGYVKFLDGLKDADEQLWKAWRMGSWDVFIGQVFGEFIYQTHVLPAPKQSLDGAKRVICFDWGYNDPGCAIWLTICPENQYGVRRLYAEREIYQNGKTPEEWADDINTITQLQAVEFIVLPHDCFNRVHGGQTIASIFASRIKNPDDSPVLIVDGHTLTKGMRLNRVAMTHQFLAKAADGKPYLYILERCRNLIRTLPELVYDDTNVEDVDTTGEDHAWDALSLGLVTVRNRYNLLSGAVRSVREEKVTPIIQPSGQMQSPDFFKEMKLRAAQAHRGLAEK